MFISPEQMVTAVEQLEELAKENQKELDAYGKGGRANNYARMVVHDDKYIYIFRKADLVIDYLNYTPDLYGVLAVPGLCSFKRNGYNRTQMEIMNYRHEGKTYSPMLNRFAYFYYDSGMDAERFLLGFKEINELAKKNGIEIDHADNNFYNNCRWNLSAIPKTENGMGGKGSLLAQIKPPYFCFIGVVPTGGYRLKFGYIAVDEQCRGIIGQEWFIFCPEIKALNSFLKSVFTDFVAVGELPDHLTDWGNPQYRKATFREQKAYFASDFELSAPVIEELLEMNEDEFVVWDNKKSWAVG